MVPDTNLSFLIRLEQGWDEWCLTPTYQLIEWVEWCLTPTYQLIEY